MVSFDNFPISLWLADAQPNPIPLPVFQHGCTLPGPPQAAKSSAMRLPNLRPLDRVDGSSGEFRGKRRRTEQGRVEATKQHHQGVSQRYQMLACGFRCQRPVAEIHTGKVDAGGRD